MNLETATQFNYFVSIGCVFFALLNLIAYRRRNKEAYRNKLLAYEDRQAAKAELAEAQRRSIEAARIYGNDVRQQTYAGRPGGKGCPGPS